MRFDLREIPLYKLRTRNVSPIVLAVVTILMFFENLDIFFAIDLRACSLGVFAKSCHDTKMFVRVLFTYWYSLLFFLKVLYSMSIRCGLNSAINFNIAILSDSLPANLPPSDLGLSVHMHLSRWGLIRSRHFGIWAGGKKSSLSSA